MCRTARHTTTPNAAATATTSTTTTPTPNTRRFVVGCADPAQEGPQLSQAQGEGVLQVRQRGCIGGVQGGLRVVCLLVCLCVYIF